MDIGRSIDIDGARVVFDRTGAEGPAVIFVHGGFGSSSELWHVSMTGLPDRYSGYAINNFLRSDPPPEGYSVDSFARRLIRFAAELGLVRPVVVGHSMGGVVCQLAALHAPEAFGGLVLVGTGPSMKQHGVGQALLDRLRGEGVSAQLMQEISANWFHRHPMRRLLSLSTCLAASLSLAPAASVAQARINAIGGFSNQYQNSQIEKPFFEGLGDVTDGAYEVRFRSINELGLRGFDAFRQLQSGAFQVMAISPGYVSGDDPFVLGLDLPGIMPRLEIARTAIDAYRAPLTERVRERFDGEVLAIWPYPAQMLFCSGAMSSLEDLEGKKVRVFSSALNDLVTHFGATGVTLAFSEVYPSLQRGTIDCAVTASLSGNEAKWFEVTDTLYTLPMSWAIQLHVANGDFWDSLSEEQQAVMTSLFAEMEAEMWSVAEAATRDGVNCSTGAEPCEIGTSADMARSDFSAEDEALLVAAVEEVVLPGWAAECEAAYPGCTEIWNETVGAATGYAIE